MAEEGHLPPRDAGRTTASAPMERGATSEILPVEIMDDDFPLFPSLFNFTTTISQLSNVTYQDIHATLATEVAVNLNCSSRNPCSIITMESIMLTYKNQVAKASCNRALVTSSDSIQPAINCL